MSGTAVNGFEYVDKQTLSTRSRELASSTPTHDAAADPIWMQERTAYLIPTVGSGVVVEKMVDDDHGKGDIRFNVQRADEAEVLLQNPKEDMK